MQDFEVLDWFQYTRFQNENMSLEAMQRAGVIRIRKVEDVLAMPLKRGRGRPKGSKNKVVKSERAA